MALRCAGLSAGARDRDDVRAAADASASLRSRSLAVQVRVHAATERDRLLLDGPPTFRASVADMPAEEDGHPRVQLHHASVRDNQASSPAIIFQRSNQKERCRPVWTNRPPPSGEDGHVYPAGTASSVSWRMTHTHTHTIDTHTHCPDPGACRRGGRGLG